MAVIRMVLVIPSLMICQLRRRCIAAKTKAPKAPIAPASVGVAIATLMPGKPPILPKTAKIKMAEGIMPRKQVRHNFQPVRVRASLGIAGRSPGRIRESKNV